MVDSWDYEKIVLKSIQIDGSWIRSDIIHFEQEEWADVDKKKDPRPFKVKKEDPRLFGDPLAPATVSKALKSLLSKQIIGEKRISHKNVWYWQRLDKKIAYIADKVSQEITSIAEDISQVMRESAKAEIGSDNELAPKEKEEVLEGISEDKEEYGAFVASILIEQAFKIIKSTNPELADKAFYIDSNGLIAPKEQVDKMINAETRTKILSSNSIGGHQFRHFYQKMKQQEN